MQRKAIQTQTMLLFVAATLVCSLFTACGGPPPPVRKPMAVKAPPAPPPWLQGDYPVEEAFFGHGKAPMNAQGVEMAEKDAKKSALNNISLEMNLLVEALKADYEEVTASGPGWYDRYAMFDRFDEAAKSTLDKAIVAERWTDRSQKPEVVHVLVKLPVAGYYQTLFDNKAIPDEPKKRMKDYERTFTRAVMDNLGR